MGNNLLPLLINYNLIFVKIRNMYKYYRKELLDIMISKIKSEKPHKNYDHTVSYAKWCNQIMSGEGHKDLIVKYTETETEKQQERRIKLYNSRTKYVSNKVMSTFMEVERTDSIVDTLYYKDKSDSAIIRERLNRFSIGNNLNKYVHDMARRLNFHDPNSFVAIEFKYLDPLKKPYAYPVELNSPSVFDYEYDNGLLQYLISKVEIDMKKENSTEISKGSKYTIYGPLFTYTLTQVLAVEPGVETYVINKNTYVVREFNTKFESVPAFHIGYQRDSKTKWETFVSPFDPAKEILSDLINTKCEYDLHKALHGFIQKYVYVDRCKYRNPDNGDSCNDGKMKISGAECHVCKGTGKLSHTSVQDVVYVPVPETKEEAIPLNQFIHYVEVPLHIIQSYKDDLVKLEKDVALAIFNKDTFSRSDIAFTATEVRLNEQSVHNVLADFADNVSRMINTATLLVADMLGDLDKIVFEYKILKDFKLLGIDELIELRRRAKEAEAPYDVIQQIDIDILSKQNQGNNLLVEQIKSEQSFKPFKHLSNELRALALADLPANDPDRVLFLFFDNVFANVWERFPNFHKIDRAVQVIIVGEEVNKIIDVKYANIQTTPVLG